MYKKGFTLIELLAVILILGIIALIAIPSITKILDEARYGAFQSTIKNIDRSIENKCTTQQITNSSIDTHYKITDGKINPSVEIKGDLPDGDIYVDKNCNVSYELSNKNYSVKKDENNTALSINKCSSNCEKYKETILNGNIPSIANGMIPVTISNNGIVKKADLYSKWYSYAEKQWANAVLVRSEVRNHYQDAPKDTEIQLDDILGYFVWIPRFKYRISTGGTSTPSAIDIVFENIYDDKSTGDAVTTYYSHPAFKFGDNELNGFWSGKFETTGTSNIPTVLPNTKSIKGLYVGQQFDVSLKFTNETYGILNDSHMMKNSEWGAISYLTNSNYGKCTNNICNEVRFNNNQLGITGCGAINETSERTDNCEIQYNLNDNYPQSTNDNITGIFDMSGGLWEKTMGNYNHVIGLSKFSTLPDSKYYDLYTTTDVNTACNNNVCLGHGLSETKNWYSDGKEFINNSYSWTSRGGYFSENNGRSGIFYYSIYAYDSVSITSFRMTITG